MITPFLRSLIPVLFQAVMAAAIVPTLALADPAKPGSSELDTSNGVAPVRPTTAPQAAAPAATGEAQRFCQNVAAAAADARYVWQTRRLTDLQGQVNDQITALEAKEQELKALLARRDDALKRADAALVGIYAKMKPDTAAAQLAVLDDDLAAAVLQQLNPRAASAILDEIAPERAAKLVNTIAGTTPQDDKKS
jgi:flagellar motility protein MotE (MotC chaperone)